MTENTGWVPSIDGVKVSTATTAQLNSYKIVDQQLNGLSVPTLLNSANPHERVFFAFMDGTNNDAINNSAEMTNVGRLYNSMSELNDPRIAAGYSPGVGSNGNPLDSATGYTYKERLENIYEELGRQTAAWKAEDPDVVVRVVEIGFSRGAAAIGELTQMVDSRGIQDPLNKVVSYAPDADNPNVMKEVISYNGTALQMAGTTAQAVLSFDPVATGEIERASDMRLASSVISGFQLNAGNEYRDLFPVTSVIDNGSSTPGFLSATVAGAHSDVGGSYQLGGLADRSYNLGVKYLNGLLGGLNIGTLLTY